MLTDRYTFGVIAGASGYAALEGFASGRTPHAFVMLTICVISCISAWRAWL